MQLLIIDDILRLFGKNGNFFFKDLLYEHFSYEKLSVTKSLNMEECKMEDKKIICKDCGNKFVFTVGEQEFYKEKGFDNDPVRCADCRRARKQQNNRR